MLKSGTKFAGLTFKPYHCRVIADDAIFIITEIKIYPAYPGIFPASIAS
jgi:hypothetical protein